MSLSRMWDLRIAGNYALTDVFRAYPQAYETGCGSMKEPEAAEHAEQEGSFERPWPA